MNFKKWVKSIQTAGYNGARTVKYKKIYKKAIIENNFERHFARNCVKKMEFYFQSNSVMNSLKCPKSTSLSHCPTELFPMTLLESHVILSSFTSSFHTPWLNNAS